jgi:Transposase zinc-binding domain
MARPALEVADIFRDHGAAWRLANRGHVSLLQLKVMSAIESCRTTALGGHVARCEDCAHTTIAYNSCLMGKFRNGELATGLGRQSSVFQMVRRRSACLLLSITTVVRRDRPTGDRAPGDTRSSLRVVVDRTRETCDHRNLPAPWIPTKSSKPLRPLGHLLCGNDPLTSGRLIASPRGGP